MGSQRVYTSKTMARAAGVCSRGRGRGTATGEGTCCGLAASTGTATREGTCRGLARRREGNARIRKIDAKALEHTRPPTKSATRARSALEPRTQGQGQGRARLEEGAPHIRGCTTGVGVGHGGVGVGGWQNCQPSTRIQAILSAYFPTTRQSTQGEREGAGAETHSRKA